MYQKDYILRAIEMLSELIAAIMSFIGKSRYPEAEKMLHEAYTTMLKEDAGFFRSIPTEQLTQKLLSEHNYTNHHLDILAELFYLEAELNFAQEKWEMCLEYYQKSLNLFKFVASHSQTFSIDKQNKIEKIAHRINNLPGVPKV